MFKSLFPSTDPATLKHRLQPPEGIPRLLIDTDAANEIDDQFALAWALLSSKQLKLEAITAAPFSFAHHREGLLAAQSALDNKHSIDSELVGAFRGWVERLHKQERRAEDIRFTDTAEGMELSYQEIKRICSAVHTPAGSRIFRGAKNYLHSVAEPIHSDATEAIIDLARSADPDPLYIAVMGCVTNIASALLIAPEIIRDIIVIWTSAYPSCSPHCNQPSLNLVQDTQAARVLFDSGVPLIYLPGYQVGAQLTISLPEMERFVAGKGEIGDLLFQLYSHNPLHDMFAIENTEKRTWVIWDIIDIAWLLNAEWVPSHLTTSPILTTDLYWQKEPTRHLIREAHDIQRDEIFLDFYQKLELNHQMSQRSE